MRPIKLSPELKEALLKKFMTQLEEEKLSDGKFSFSESIFTATDATEKPQIIFSPEAYLKMVTLINNTDSEIGWHGLVQRDGNTYTIYDILVFPQTVTAATVNTDQAKYNTWLMEQPDEIFNHIRMQGHSHVNMGVTPSAQDKMLYDSILKGLPDHEYYLFFIFNKKHDFYALLYDMPNNTLYEQKDMDICVMFRDGAQLNKWYKYTQDTYITKTPSSIYTADYSNVRDDYSKENKWQQYYDHEGYLISRDTPRYAALDEKKKPGRPKKEDKKK